MSAQTTQKNVWQDRAIHEPSGCHLTVCQPAFLETATTALAHTSSLDTDLTRNTRAPHFTPQHWLLCHMGLY